MGIYNEPGRKVFKISYTGVVPMKKTLKNSILTIFVLLLPFSTSYAALDGLVYYLYVRGPAWVWTPTFEFEGGNDLLVIGASHEYGVLNGVWQEVPLGLFSFFWAQVESDEPTTTTTIPEIPEVPGNSSLGFQPAQTEKTKFLINLWGLAFTLPPLGPAGTTFSILIGSGDYLTATPAYYVGFAGVPGPGADPEFVSIRPDTGTQEQQLTVTISGSNTTFQDTNLDEVNFTPENNIDVGQCSVQSNTEIECDITIRADAQLGAYTVTVIYDNLSEFIIGTEEFTVVE
jgi:hypothetical protein